jgi:hypothetical protein
MNIQVRGFARRASIVLAAASLLTPFAAFAQTSSNSSERWLHVRVISTDSNGETVKVNVPLELAEKVLPAINKDRLQHGKVKVENLDCNGVDLRALLDAVRNTKDGEFVSVQATDADVNVAKKGEYLLVHVTDKSDKHWKYEEKLEKKSEKSTEKSEKNRTHESRVEVKVPMKVVEALLSGGKDELDLVAALRALGNQGETELVSVKDDENTVRVWLDNKNISD